MLGAFYALLSAATFGFNNVSMRRGVLTGTTFQGLAISVPIGVPLFLLAAVIGGELAQFDKLSTFSIACLAGGGFAHFIWGRYFNYRSLEAIGSNLSGPLQQAQLLLSLILAILLLGETLTPLKVLGILLIVLGPAFILRGRAAEKRRAARNAPMAAGAAVVADAGLDSAKAEPAKPAFKPRMMEGTIFALLAALGFGTSPILVSAGLKETGLSLLGGLISYIVATLFIALCLIVPRNFRDVRNMDREALPWFTLAAVSVWVSQFFRYLALGIAPVTVVQPIQSLSLIFRMIFGYFINREHEVFDRYVLGGIVLSFTGALALSISDEVVTRYLALPDWLAPLAAWRWP